MVKHKPKDSVVSAIAEARGLEKDAVAQDLSLLAHYYEDPVAAVNHNYVTGDGWLYNPLEPFQEYAVKRFFGPEQQIAEIMPRGHGKTTINRICTSLAAFLGMERYQVVASLTDGNAKGNIEAVESLLRDPRFEAIRWLATYVHGENIAYKSNGNEFHFGGKCLIEYRSIMGEMRGMNRAEYGGRPSRFVGDDIIPTEAATSKAIRDNLRNRYFSMVRPIGGKASDGTRTKFTIYGTIMHPEDILNKMLEGKLEGYSCTKPEYRQVETDGVFLWPSLWDEEALASVRREYESDGIMYLFRREFYNDPLMPDSHPLSNWILNRLDPYQIYPELMHRVICVDHAHGAGRDWFVALEYGTDALGNKYILDLRRSQEWNIEQRKNAVYEMVARRKPNILVVENTSESRSFIEELDNYLQSRGAGTTVHAPSASERGNKNFHILGRVEPLKINGTLYAREDHARMVESEATDWCFDDADNVDDILDTLANAERHSQKPKPVKRPESDLEKRVRELREKTNNRYYD